MRPRHYTAENILNAIHRRFEAEASMRPRHYTAENRSRHHPHRDEPHASMRPRHYTAENGGRIRRSCRLSSRFNEAAALHRGKRTNRALSGTEWRRFNEAAALHRGKLTITQIRILPHSMLQ